MEKFLENKRLWKILQDAESSLSISFVRSTWSGGQNVNKRSTACQIIDTFDYKPLLPKKNLSKYKSPIVVKYSRERSQEQNRKRAIQIWKEKIIILFTIDKPRNKNPKVAARIKRKLDRKRLDNKKNRSNIKKDRGKINY